MKDKYLRQGDTTSVLITFDESIGQKDLKVGLYDSNDREVFSATLSGGGVTALGGNTYQVIIGHEVTVGLAGAYYLDLLLKSPNDTSYVNTGERPVNLIFKKAVISKNLQ